MLFNLTYFSLLISTQPNILRSWDAYSVYVQFCRSCFKSLSLLFFLLGALHGLWFFPDQGWNSCLLQWNCRVLTAGPPGKSIIMGFFFFKIFWCGSFLKYLLNVLQYCLLFLCFDFLGLFLCFDLSGGTACGISAPWPGIEPTFLALEGEILTTRPPGTSTVVTF